MTAALRRSRTIRPSLAQIISATVLSQAGCTIFDERPRPTCMDPSPTCQALCASEDESPHLINCSRTTPLQNQFVNTVNSKNCNQWRELLQPVSGIPLIIEPQMIGITPTKKEPCYY
jgi:hypothetical protein